ncbi:uncharacterized protein THITE_155541 [Thermothielavioides terrestris NRRL 8126]|uniref:Uncharacterized protein n=1 Tax=Thermothielavioides terrestris (strain ATCC 38088 / NRRL 8126) TaxID=578455 RepID=G2RAL1_THETT|nr:uncharacterized protein THITE_155541 [Thermothielavioides terrestris NRRL 8126]AEO68889.1 hypothetical protein THITE_155541 [Thermothielavioides terrestris NRRL 8126]
MPTVDGKILETGINIPDLPAWLSPTSPRELFLRQGKQLSADTPSPDEPDSVFQFGLADPTPAIGAPAARAAGGGRRAAHTRATTRTLACLSCSAESMTRAPPRAASATPTCGCRACNNKSRCVSCSATASTGFRTGSRIHRLLPAGGSHPRYLGNLGIEENPGTGVTMRPARYAVRHGQSAVSKLVLPVTASGAVWFGGWLMKQGLSLVLY